MQSSSRRMACPCVFLCWGNTDAACIARMSVHEGWAFVIEYTHRGPTSWRVVIRSVLLRPPLRGMGGLGFDSYGRP